jgi:hypothetical protein
MLHQFKFNLPPIRRPKKKAKAKKGWKVQLMDALFRLDLHYIFDKSRPSNFLSVDFSWANNSSVPLFYCCTYFFFATPAHSLEETRNADEDVTRWPPHTYASQVALFKQKVECSTVSTNFNSASSEKKKKTDTGWKFSLQ